MAAVHSIVALKPLAVAKSRFRRVADPLRQRLVLSMALDTITTLRTFGPVTVVTDQPGFSAWCTHLPGIEPITVLADGGRDLCAALTFGARKVAARPVLACVADLPGLQASEVAELLAEVSGEGWWFLPDNQQTGTTMVLSSGGFPVVAFGPDSARRHRALGGQEFAISLPGAQLDVDTIGDLGEAARRGTLGRWTHSLIDGQQLAEYQSLTITHDGAIAVSGVRYQLSPNVFCPDLRKVNVGQQVHAAIADSHIQAMWI